LFISNLTTGSTFTPDSSFLISRFASAGAEFSNDKSILENTGILVMLSIAMI
jgi:hypothetical protein